MKTNYLLISTFIGITLAGFIITGCHKASSATDTDYTAAADEAYGSTAANDTKNVSDAAMTGNSNQYGPVRNIHSVYTTNCNVIFDSNSSTTDSVYITFGDGTNPVECKDYRWRKGEIIVYWPKSAGTFLSAYFDSAATVTETFKNYAVGTSSTALYGIAGSRTWTNKGINVTSEYENWNFTANLTITNPAGKTFTWNSVRTNALAEVNYVWYYEISGTAYGTTETGVGYTLTIISPLYVTAIPWWSAGGCSWIEAGTISINRTTSTNTLTVNFGSIGTCDNQAVATINGNNYTIYLW